MPQTLLTELKPGDLILSGKRTFFSEVTQSVSGSSFGHATAVIDENQLIEATDIALTPGEGDEGVIRQTMAQFESKTMEMDNILVLRPSNLDIQSFAEVAERMIEASPTYPSVGAILMGFSCLFVGLTEALPSVLREPIVRFQYRILADGPGRVHCGELVVRLYVAAGMPVLLRRPVLADVISHSRNLQPRLLSMSDKPRKATPGVWPRGMVRPAVFAITETATTLKGRIDQSTPRDYAGLVVPGDLERSPSFSPVFAITRKRSGWELVA